MNKAEYLAIKQQLSFDKPIWATLLTTSVQLGLFAIAFILLLQNNFVTFILSQFLFALFFFHGFAMLHEAGHGNLHKTRWVNTALGHFFSIFCLMPYFSWKHMHQGHHLWTGSINKDPGSKTLLKLRKLGKVPFIYDISWRTWIPLPAIVQHIRLWLYPYNIWKGDPKNISIIKQSVFSVLFLGIMYTALQQAFPQIITIENFGLSIFLYFILTETINVPHHVSMPHYYSSPERDKLHPWEQHISTRSCRYPGILSELIALNFNLHIEHHYFPNLPWYRLKKLRDILKPILGKDYTEVSDFGWNIKHRKISAKDIILTDIQHPLLQPHT